MEKGGASSATANGWKPGAGGADRLCSIWAAEFSTLESWATVCIYLRFAALTASGAWLAWDAWQE